MELIIGYKTKLKRKSRNHCFNKGENVRITDVDSAHGEVWYSCRNESGKRQILIRSELE